MVAMINKELVLQKGYLGENKVIKTLYFGGGTPSLLSFTHLESISQTIRRNYTTDLEEITLETNPDDLSAAKLAELKKVGIDRLSIGIQSFDGRILKFCNRAHSAKEALEALEKAKGAGFERLSIDLMYGFPHQDHSIWEKDLAIAILQEPDHISSYCLTISPKTALGKWEKQGRFVQADEEFVAVQFEIMQERLGSAGYIQYEISNFAKPGKYASHNSNYWRSVPYLGIGPSAHSFDGKSRQFNVANNNRYIKSIKEDLVPSTLETFEGVDRLNEYLLTSLRTIWGVDLNWIEANFQINLTAEKEAILDKLQSDGLLQNQDQKLTLTNKGKLLADSIASSLFL